MNYTLQVLDEQCEMVDLGLEPLYEAGGLTSWLKRTFTGIDNGIERDVRLEL